MEKHSYFDDFCNLSEAKLYRRSIFLCSIYEDDDLFTLFKPTDKELDKHATEGYSTYAWGEPHKPAGGIAGHFTPLRQNIVLLMAAMNNEKF
jgi:hypothetical protein